MKGSESSKKAYHRLQIFDVEYFESSWFNVGFLLVSEVELVICYHGFEVGAVVERYGLKKI